MIRINSNPVRRARSSTSLDGAAPALRDQPYEQPCGQPCGQHCEQPCQQPSQQLRRRHELYNAIYIYTYIYIYIYIKYRTICSGCSNKIVHVIEHKSKYKSKDNKIYNKKHTNLQKYKNYNIWIMYFVHIIQYVWKNLNSSFSVYKLFWT